MGTLSRQLPEQKVLQEETGYKTTDVQYKLDGAKAKITKFEGREGCYRMVSTTS